MKRNNSAYLILFLSIFFINDLSAQPTFDCSDFLPSQCQNEFLDFVEDIVRDGKCKQWNDDCDYDRAIYRVGKVSIGTSQSSSFSLTVTGGVVSPNLKVCENAGAWCDYVFEEDYKLLSLEHVEKQIQEKGHLHKTPSAAEIESQGHIDIGDVLLDHQEKIEEVFLHLIAMKKKADFLRKKLDHLQKENQLLKKGP